MFLVQPYYTVESKAFFFFLSFMYWPEKSGNEYYCSHGKLKQKVQIISDDMKTYKALKILTYKWAVFIKFPSVYIAIFIERTLIFWVQFYRAGEWSSAAFYRLIFPTIQ